MSYRWELDDAPVWIQIGPFQRLLTMRQEATRSRLSDERALSCRDGGVGMAGREVKVNKEYKTRRFRISPQGRLLSI